MLQESGSGVALASYPDRLCLSEDCSFRRCTVHAVFVGNLVHAVLQRQRRYVKQQAAMACAARIVYSASCHCIRWHAL
jgi:hypothetical protein